MISYFSNGPVAQRLEQRTHNPLVESSNLSGPISNSLQYNDLQKSFCKELFFCPKVISKSYQIDSKIFTFFEKNRGSPEESHF